MTRIAAHQDAGKRTVLALTLLAGSAACGYRREVPLVRNAAEWEKSCVSAWSSPRSFFHGRSSIPSSRCTTLMILIQSSGAEASADATNQGLAFPGRCCRPIWISYIFVTDRHDVPGVRRADYRAGMRGLALTHGIVSFFYATGILALTINMVGGLI